MVRARLQTITNVAVRVHHPPRSRAEMSDLLDADLGRPALEVLTRLCDQGVRPAVLVYPYETRARR